MARDLTGDEAFAQSTANFSIVVRPELIVTQVSNPPGLLAPGSSFSISDVVNNVGNADAPGSTTRYYLSLDGTKSADDLRLSASRAVPVLPPGGQSAGTIALSLSTTTPVGVYTFFACSDDTGTVAGS